MFGKQKIIVPIEVSARHCHISKEDLENLFGNGYELEKIKQLSQPSDFACKETIDIEFGSKKIEKVRIVGPLRSQTQIEVSLTDVIGSGIVPPVKRSGDLDESSAVTILGPLGKIELLNGLVISHRHIHCSIDEAKKYNLKDGDLVSVRVAGERGVIFENIIVRVKDNYKFCLQLDTDEGNAAGINKTGEGILIK